MPLRASAIRARLRAHGLNAPVTVADRTGSTQDDALAGLRTGAPHGAVYAAERQSRGRGRRGRRWLTTPGGLLFSVIVRNGPADPGSTGRLTIAAAVGTVRAIQTCTGASASIKWPNDLVFGQAKAGGVLVETHGDAAAVGVGLNVFSGAGMAEGQATTAVAAFATRPLERNELLAACVVEMLGLPGGRGRRVGRGLCRVGAAVGAAGARGRGERRGAGARPGWKPSIPTARCACAKRAAVCDGSEPATVTLRLAADAES